MTHNKKFQKMVFIANFSDNFESQVLFVTKNKFWDTEVAITADKYCITNARKYK
jgi:hypothetical protein